MSELDAKILVRRQPPGICGFLTRASVAIAIAIFVGEILLTAYTVWRVPPNTSYRAMGLSIWLFLASAVSDLVSLLVLLQCAAVKAWKCCLIAFCSMLLGGPIALIAAAVVMHLIDKMHGLRALG